jgi:hypothetical protein
MQVFTDHLLLAPASDGSANPGGKLEVASDDGSAAAAVQSYSGPGVRWLSSSALARPGMGFGGTIMQGFADGSSDVPHFLLEQTLFGGKVLLSLVLWPRRDWMLDDAYLQRYYGTGQALQRTPMQQALQLHTALLCFPAFLCSPTRLRAHLQRSVQPHDGTP